jgi:murein DD-endopeptidase MepM/ murein hydrolase activator NlpD
MSQAYPSYKTHEPMPARHSHERTAIVFRQNPSQASHKLTAITAFKSRRNFGAVAFGTIIGVAISLSAWSLATRTHAAFLDDMQTRRATERAQRWLEYEDRIADLRAQIDRVTSRQLLDQGQVEQKLDALLKRQDLLEQRTSVLSESTAPHPAKRGRISTPYPSASPLKSSRNDKVSNLDQTLERLSGGLDEVEQHQTAVLGKMEEEANRKLHRIRDALSEAGINPSQSKAGTDIGGPFVPLKVPRGDESTFGRLFYDVNVTRAEVDRYNQILNVTPVRKPVTGEIDMSSLFGVRSDPFFHRPAMHTGIDLRGEAGEPVHATASGRVTIAGHDGGYGNLVEINHGSGLATRYGHLSKIDVKIGQRVRIGQIIGEIGSTGRSTGPHLHYETRVNGQPVDPQKFLHAGSKLGSL